MNVMSLRLEEKEMKLIEEMARKEGKDKSTRMFPKSPCTLMSFSGGQVTFPQSLRRSLPLPHNLP